MEYQEEINLLATKEQLRSWAYWCNDIITMGLGYSKKNIIAQLIETKGEVIKGTNPHLLPENRQAEIIDQLINEYAVNHRKKAQVLVSHYVDNSSIKNKIAFSKLSKPSYYRYLKEAEIWLSRQLF